MLLVLLASLVHAQEAPKELAWDLTLNGKSVGQRTLKVRSEQLGDVELRTLQAETRVDASMLGMSFAYRQKLTANADIGPASFISVIEQRHGWHAPLCCWAAADGAERWVLARRRGADRGPEAQASHR